MKKPKREEWKLLAPKIPEKPKRLTLQLNPDNSVYIDKFLTFVNDMRLTKPKQFIVYAELNLTSITVRSPYIRITVKPPLGVFP
jgi:hypothetical protein